MNYFLHVGVMLTIIRVHHPIPARENREHPGNFQNKSVSSTFSWVTRYIIFLAKLKRRGRPFLKGARRGGTLWDYPLRPLGCHKRWKSVSFSEILNNPTSPFFLLDPLTNKHCRTQSSMTCGYIPGHNKSKESCCQQGKGLGITQSLQKKTFLGNMMLSHWPCFTWKFFIILFLKILDLIFQAQASCPNLTAFLEIFLHLKNNDSVEPV